MTNAAKIKAPFSREQLLSLKVGQKMIDAQGGSWEIVSEIRKVGPSDLEFDVKYEDSTPIETLRWTDEQLIDMDEFAIDIHLNHPNARIA